MFMWMVTVPANKVKEKIEQYRVPPDTGAIVVKDESEVWESVHPVLRATDASADLSAVRHMIDAGSGYPPHWRGEGGDANLATATAMQGPTEKHLVRRQQYFIHILEDILYHGYQRAAEIGLARALTTRDYSLLFQAEMPDISTVDNAELAQPPKTYPNPSPSWAPKSQPSHPSWPGRPSGYPSTSPVSRSPIPKSTPS